ncbi:hypothetical protein LTR91_008521 [Friedmanniomyces endolithicus]|uniref:Uncharacterized protein n=1 Tax=Friedmanniomyces endolithicus TaxID=329885 RepID=A0AAN6FRZ0_9PEZI|nr:hypothetical protein LTR35_003535 [Friedmanniomyces endolithicus]KAK0294027.1 hypothetical protein LTS00_007366 [Friedmanniomyces endolithicus]KAK0312094.1 hypothetical protein LTR01_003008 [Friedmanniomyces endolithicus]KAK0321710.1 hypothetical protein LTR82_007196 [Friedmanniomyces endolithicus]KAK0832327.1 hypothetical protein LTR73_002614 [Friedmanniomyces endolithicus]
METITSYPATPTTQISHLRHSATSRPKNQKPNPIPNQTQNQIHAPRHGPAQPAMRMPPPETHQQEQSLYPQPLSAPASQESFITTRSEGSSVQPFFQSSSSNVSQLTNDTDPTSPVVPAPEQRYEPRGIADSTVGRRATTPEGQVQSIGTYGEHALGSPMSVASPAASTTNRAKRTASGYVKNAPGQPSTPLAATFADRMSRRESISSTGSRAGELAATLKSRLGYAMAKVQHGWEHKNLAEVEQLAAQKMSPNRHSMSHLDDRQRPMSAGLSNGTARLSMYESYRPSMLDGTTSPPSKRRSGTYSSFLASPQQQPGPRTAWNNAPHLQPPADIRPGGAPTSQQPYYFTAPPSHNSAQTAMSPPRTPVNSHPHSSRTRPPTIRTGTEQAEAERDALQALFQLGSPRAASNHNNSNNSLQHFVSASASSAGAPQSHAAMGSQASSVQASPMRMEFPAMMPMRRVTFARSESGGSSGEGEGSSSRLGEAEG